VGVIIGNNVEISSLSNIHSGTIEPTIIEDFVQTDVLAHIAHNCVIKRGTCITACSEISGSTIVGTNCMIGPNSSLMNKISIGNNVTIGLGTAVTKSFPDDDVIAGNLADTTTNLKKNKEILKKIIDSNSSK